MSTIDQFSRGYELDHRSENMKRILIVDDSALMRSTVRKLLEDHHDWVVCGEAENGSDGVEKAKHLRPDLVVMDIVMPVLNGIEASRLLRRLLPNMLIVIFSTFADTNIEAAALAAGAHAVVDKSEGASLIGNIQQLFAADLSSGCAA
jgi:two-component system, chemotaxis family, chemotaxis protein CheY